MSEQALDMSVPESEPGASAAASVSSAGQLLAAKRQSQGWSIEQVAAQLKLAPRQIEAIEADRLESLPSLVVARGFIRTYARLLKMDSAPLLATVSSDTRSPIESIRSSGGLSAPFSKTRLPSMHSRGASPRWIAGLVLLLAVGAGIWGAWQMRWLPAAPARLLAAVGEEPSAPVVSDKAHSPQAPAQVTAAPQAAVPAEKADSVQLIGVANAEPSPPLVKIPAVLPADTAVVAAAPAVGNNSLSLVMHQDSWIEIKQENGTVLVSRLAKAGTTETFDVVAPVLLVVGNVAGVEASLRDIPLNLKAVTSTNVARINLK